MRKARRGPTLFESMSLEKHSTPDSPREFMSEGSGSEKRIYFSINRKGIIREY